MEKSEKPRDMKLHSEPGSRDGVLLILAGGAYFLTSIGITPHMLFLTDYLHHRFGTTIDLSSQLF